MSPITRAVSSTTGLVISRLATAAVALMLPLMGWLALQYLNQRFDEVRTVATAAAVTAQQAAATGARLDARVDVIQANMANGAADRTDFQIQITHQVEKLTDVVTATSNQVSAISATLNASHVAALKGLP